MSTTTRHPRRPPDPNGPRHVDPPKATPGQLAQAMAAGVFTADEAAAFLRFPSVAAFRSNLRRFGVKGVRVGWDWNYSRETLEALRQRMFGLDGPGKKARRA